MRALDEVVNIWRSQLNEMPMHVVVSSRRIQYGWLQKRGLITQEEFNLVEQHYRETDMWDYVGD